MWKLILILLAVVGVAALSDLGGSAERTEQVRYAAQRNESQATILTALQAMNDPAVSEFATDWRKTYPEPSPGELAELRDIEQRIKNDRTAAIKMTRAYKAKNSPICNGEVSALFSSSKPDCPPGL